MDNFVKEVNTCYGTILDQWKNKLFRFAHQAGPSFTRLPETLRNSIDSAVTLLNEILEQQTPKLTTKLENIKTIHDRVVEVNDALRKRRSDYRIPLNLECATLLVNRIQTASNKQTPDGIVKPPTQLILEDNKENKDKCFENFQNLWNQYRPFRYWWLEKNFFYLDNVTREVWETAWEQFDEMDYLSKKDSGWFSSESVSEINTAYNKVHTLPETKETIEFIWSFPAMTCSAADSARSAPSAPSATVAGVMVTGIAAKSKLSQMRLWILLVLILFVAIVGVALYFLGVLTFLN